MTNSNTPSSPAPRRRAIVQFKWLALALLAIDALLLAIIWSGEDKMRQLQFIFTMYVAVISMGVLFVWAMTLSGFRVVTRIVVLAAAIAGVVTPMSLYRIEGVDGNLLPIITRRGQESKRAASTVVAAKINALPAPAGHKDYNQFLGPNRNAVLGGPRLASNWELHPPTLLWRQPVGESWSAFAVQGDRAVTQEQRGDEERVTCYDLRTGHIHWTHSDTARYATTIAGVGPRATPTIAGDKVYTVGATGMLNCLDLSSGKRVWSINIITDNGAWQPDWGFSGSPLVVDNMVVVNPGGDGHSLVAYDAAIGSKIWSGGHDDGSYASPMIATIAGVRQIVILNHRSIAGHDPATGALLWEHTWPAVNYSDSRASKPKVAQPVVVPGDRLFVSSSYGVGCAMFQLKRDDAGQWSVSVLWSNMNMKAKFTNVVYHDGYIYGLDEGVLACIDVETGDRKWKDGRYGHGQLILVGDVLLIQVEDGDVVLVEAISRDLHELARMSALTDKTWNSPTLAGSVLLVRNHREAAAYLLATEEGDENDQ